MKKVTLGFVSAAAFSLFLTETAIAASPDDEVLTEDPNDTSKRVCRSVMPTGSRFTQRVCKTEAQWKRDAERAQRMLDDSNRRLISPPTGIPGPG